MEPSNITMLLNESPGIVVQQTSAVSGNASIRIQGLDGRYTQLLKDGFPLYGGFSGGLSIFQVPPLDLRQVEIVKGPASTLYGGGAIAGLVNLVSKTPGPEAAPAERSLLFNATSAGGFDAGAFLSDRVGKVGYTVLGSANTSRAYDGDGDAFTNLPQTRRLTLAPRAFFYPSERTTAWARADGYGRGARGRRRGRHRDGRRATSSAPRAGASPRRPGRSPLSAGPRSRCKQSTNLFDRSTELPGYRFEGTQVATYSEASALIALGAHDLVVGLDLRTDAFDQREAEGPELDYAQGAPACSRRTRGTSPTGSRSNWAARRSPRRARRVRAAPSLGALPARASVSLRATGGLGYKAPTVFLEPSEEPRVPASCH